MKSAKGVKSINTAVKSQIHAIPNPLRATYLDLFMLQKEREKLEKECGMMRKVLKNNLKRISEIKNQMTELLAKQDLPLSKVIPLPKGHGLSSNDHEKAEWKTVELGY